VIFNVLRTGVIAIYPLIDSNLTFKNHIVNLTGKLSSGCYVLGIVSGNLDFATARMAYFALLNLTCGMG